MGKLEQFAEEVPQSLQHADAILTFFGRSVRDRRSQARCGSAERNYTPTKGEAFEIRREPREVMMGPDEYTKVQRALLVVPEVYRKVLHILYIPQRLPPQAQLRICKIPPRLCRERHIAGLRMFDNNFRA